MKWRRTLNSWHATGNCGRWSIWKYRNGTVRVMINGGILILPNQGFVENVTAGKRLAGQMEREAKQAKG